MAREGFCSRLSPQHDGNLTSRKIPGAVLHDPELVKERVVNMVLNEEIVSRHGETAEGAARRRYASTATSRAALSSRAPARQGLEAAGLRVVPLPEMTLG